jgi:ABC-type phosphate transport system substrate-binding protein
MKLAYTTVFDPGFNTSANPTACNGTQGSGGKPTVSYTASGSGAGLESWGVNGHPASFGPTNAFVATEEPPNPTEKAEIEANETPKGSAPESVLSIPVAQESIAIIVHLPASCSATSPSNPGRLVLTDQTLEGILRGTIGTWSAITGGGDALSGAGCSSAITKVVRADSAGSTHILKRYLNLINEAPFKAENGKEQSWGQLSEGAGNPVWPTAAAVVRPAKTGDTAEVAKVAEVAGSIGYASLANARANSAFVPPAGGPGTAAFWAPVENSGGKKKQKFADPSTDGDTAASAQANCVNEKYTQGKGSSSPPSSVQSTWQAVTTATKEKNYTLCGLAYQLALTKFSAYPLTSQPEEQTAFDFSNFLLETKAGGGQALIAGADYAALPKKLAKEAAKGGKLVGF